MRDEKQSEDKEDAVQSELKLRREATALRSKTAGWSRAGVQTSSHTVGHGHAKDGNSSHRTPGEAERRSDRPR